MAAGARNAEVEMRSPQAPDNITYYLMFIEGLLCIRDCDNGPEAFFHSTFPIIL